MTSRKPSPHPRKRTGAQPRNTNTFKHGFYGDLLTPDEQDGLAHNISLDDEQKLLRSHARRLAARIKLSPTLSFGDLRPMQTLLQMVQVIADLERSKLVGRGKGGLLGESILDALATLDPYKDL